MERMRVCRIATVPFFLHHHLGGQIAATAREGHEVHAVSSAGPEDVEIARLEGVIFYPVTISRQISIFSDFRALLALYRYFRRQRFDIVHSATPKAGLLTAIAGALARIPLRLHTFTGQAWSELSGPVRWVSKLSDRLIVLLNTRCYADSHSQRDFLVSESIARSGQIDVLGYGSLSGVDLKRFNLEKRAAAGLPIKESLRIPNTAKVITFVGRLSKDKGIVELIAAFEQLSTRTSNDVYLVLVGPGDSRDGTLPADTRSKLSGNPRIRVVGYSAHPEDYLAMTDVFCIPSYREGFGNVVIEAAAMGIPTVATRIVGLIDAVTDGVTGILVPAKDVTSLANALSLIVSADKLREKMGQAAQLRAVSMFDADSVNRLVLEEYRRLVAP